MRANVRPVDPEYLTRFRMILRKAGDLLIVDVGIIGLIVLGGCAAAVF